MSAAAPALAETLAWPAKAAISCSTSSASIVRSGRRVEGKAKGCAEPLRIGFLATEGPGGLCVLGDFEPCL